LDILLYPEPTDALESGALRSEGERGLDRMEKAEGGGARVSIR
jgi:hypothetical protein